LLRASPGRRAHRGGHRPRGRAPARGARPFAAAIARHPTPLTSILPANADPARARASDDDREHRHRTRGALAGRSLVAEILDFAKPVRLSTASIDVGELIETAANTLSPVLSEKNIALRTEPATLTVQGDAQRLRQVLVNLVGNAADASRPGAHVTLRASAADNGNVAIEIEDHGADRRDDLPRIFEPFFTTRPDGRLGSRSVTRSCAPMAVTSAFARSSVKARRSPWCYRPRDERGLPLRAGWPS
jgi:signal transduction histidine kinase